MSLHQLLQECGGYDDGAGSDMDVCIGNDSPPASPAGSASAPPAGSTSAPLAGSKSSSLPQEDQAQKFDRSRFLRSTILPRKSHIGQKEPHALGAAAE